MSVIPFFSGTILKTNLLRLFYRVEKSNYFQLSRIEVSQTHKMNTDPATVNSKEISDSIDKFKFIMMKSS